MSAAMLRKFFRPAKKAAKSQRTALAASYAKHFAKIAELTGREENPLCHYDARVIELVGLIDFAEVSALLHDLTDA
jgi:hypothetical protein